MPAFEQDDFFASKPASDASATGGQPSAPAGADREACGAYRPLAARLRPRQLAEVVGQDHIVGPGCLLPRLIASNQIGSLIFYGPPGTGKTSLAEVIARETGSRFVQLNAVLSNTAEVRDVLRMARYRPEERTLVFIDEIHRFNKAQQDLLLPDIEAGHIRLIGATTHNPGFYVNAPLLSRSHLFRLQPIGEADILRVLQRALDDVGRGLGATGVQVQADALALLARMSEGDLRRALNAIETLVLAHPKERPLTADDVRRFARERQIRYDAGEDEHYDTASAFIKSMRGGDPDAALYWLAKMLAGGEDPRFIARRIVIFASEDIGLADPRALPLAVACFQACELVGLPECELNLAHVTVFMATAPKSNTTTEAIGRARAHIREHGVQPIPASLRDSHTTFNRQLGQGEGYLYSHEFVEAISGQRYLEPPQQFYFPREAGAEAHIRERLARWKQLRMQPQRRTAPQ